MGCSNTKDFLWFHVLSTFDQKESWSGSLPEWNKPRHIQKFIQNMVLSKVASFLRKISTLQLTMTLRKTTIIWQEVCVRPRHSKSLATSKKLMATHPLTVKPCSIVAELHENPNYICILKYIYIYLFIDIGLCLNIGSQWIVNVNRVPFTKMNKIFIYPPWTKVLATRKQRKYIYCTLIFQFPIYLQPSSQLPIYQVTRPLIPNIWGTGRWGGTI